MKKRLNFQIPFYTHTNTHTVCMRCGELIFFFNIIDCRRREIKNSEYQNKKEKNWKIVIEIGRQVLII